MAEITGSITSFNPAAGSSHASGTNVDVNAQGSVTVPAAQGGVQDTYKVTLRINIYNVTTCNTQPVQSVDVYPEVFVVKTHTTSKPSFTVSGDAYYQVTAELVSQLKQPDGSYGAETLLDRKIWQFQIGTPDDRQPRAFFCTGPNTPVQGCLAPIPADGAVVTGPQSVRTVAKFQVVGSTSSPKEFHFTFEMKVTGPEQATANTTANTTGVVNNGTSLLALVNAVSAKGEYTVVATAHAQLAKPNTGNPACHQKQLLAEQTWKFTIADGSSSSSSNSSSSSSQPSGSSSSSSQSSSSSSQQSSSSSSTASSSSSQ